MRLQKRAITAVLASTAIVASVAWTQVRGAGPQDVTSAQQTTTALANMVVAALKNITENTTPETVVANSEAVTLILAHCQDHYGLLAGTKPPLNPKNVSHDAFETKALQLALTGQTTQVVQGNRLRTVVPLNFVQKCALCHTNFAGLPLNAIVGAAEFNVPIP